MTDRKIVHVDPLFCGSGGFPTLPALKWINYAAASEGLRRLQELYDAPSTHRTPCMGIYGDSNNGKTMMALYFQRQKSAEATGNKDGKELPVIVVQVPPAADLSGLYSAILRQVNAPFSATARLSKKQDQIIGLLPQLKTRMLIIDELHNILPSQRNHQVTFLNGLKYLSNELRIPIVAIGTRDAQSALTIDDQLSNRFRPFTLPRWQPDAEFAKFVIQIFNAFDLDAKPLAGPLRSLQEFHAMTGGLTGEAWSLGRAVAKKWVGSSTKEVDLATVKATEWQPPEERR